jgi:hypothetical protein
MGRSRRHGKEPPPREGAAAMGKSRRHGKEPPPTAVESVGGLVSYERHEGGAKPGLRR